MVIKVTVCGLVEGWNFNPWLAGRDERRLYSQANSRNTIKGL